MELNYIKMEDLLWIWIFILFCICVYCNFSWKTLYFVLTKSVGFYCIIQSYYCSILTKRSFTHSFGSNEHGRLKVWDSSRIHKVETDKKKFQGDVQ